MELISTPIAGLNLARKKAFIDARGAFSRIFCDEELASCIGERRIHQINHSRTHASGAVRGLHYQHPPYAEMKLVQCIRGRVWDVVVDLRQGSSTFLQWFATELSPENQTILIIPEGMAHGFQVLAPDSELIYMHTAPYKPEYEAGLLCTDPLLGINWPLPVADLSQRDQKHSTITNDFLGLSL